jgi:hypothetical protein
MVDISRNEPGTVGNRDAIVLGMMIPALVREQPIAIFVAQEAGSISNVF